MPSSAASRSALRPLVLWTALMLGLGVAGAAVWVWLAEPAAYVVTQQGAVLTEDAVTGQFQVVAVFLAVGVVASLAWAGAASYGLRRLGWLLVPYVVVVSSLAAVLAWRLGVWWGPAEPTASSARGLAVGDTIPQALSVDVFSVFVAWPAAALVGMLGVTLAAGRRSDAAPPA